MLTSFLLQIIRWYQRTVSPDHGVLRHRYPTGYCRFYPSCSEYGYQAIEQYGATKGSYLALLRIIRCNPWNPGGVDPLQ